LTAEQEQLVLEAIAAERPARSFGIEGVEKVNKAQQAHNEAQKYIDFRRQTAEGSTNLSAVFYLQRR